jgi:hypothetical protein
VSDGIVIARGYLGMDLKLEDVAYVQKYLIKKCNLAGKPVILSTQIMESMVFRKRPTRAEVSDISNAVSQAILTVLNDGLHFILYGTNIFDRFWMGLTAASSLQRLKLDHST